MAGSAWRCPTVQFCTLYADSFHGMPRHDLRRNTRLVFSAIVELQWVEANGEPRFVQGRSKDLSEDGLRIELPVAIPLRTSVTLRIERIRLQGTASVRHVRRTGLRFILGLQLNQQLRHALLANMQVNQDLSQPMFQ